MNLICGLNPVLEALQAGTRHFDRLIVVKGLRNERVSDAITRASRLGVPLRFESRETLDRMAGGVPHQGVIAVVSAKPTIDLDGLLAQAREPALVVALDGVLDPRNLGAILRTCEAAGADGVLLPERHSVGLTETVNRASAGALEHVRVARVGNLAQAVEALKARGLWVIGFDAGGAERWTQVDYKRPLALVLGGEGRGIRRLVRERCDQVVSIPLFGQIASLNVAVAAGVALYEVVRQRGAVPTHVRPIPRKAGSPPSRIEGPLPDDPTQDPGAIPVPPVAETQDGEDEADYPISVVRHYDEDVAWGPALSAAASADGREREAKRGSHRAHEHGASRRHDVRQQQERPAAEPRQSGAPRPAQNASSQRGPRFGRGQRRRGRPASDDGAAPLDPLRPPPAEGRTTGRETSQDVPPAESEKGGGGSVPDRLPGHRRRWRRRKGVKSGG